MDPVARDGAIITPPANGTVAAMKDGIPESVYTLTELTTGFGAPVQSIPEEVREHPHPNPSSHDL